MDSVDDIDLEDTKAWWVFLLGGVLWILFAWVVLSIDYETVWAVALYFGFGLIAGGLMGVLSGMVTRSWRWVHVSFGVLSIVAGIITLIWPGQTFLVLAAVIGWFVMLAGVLDLATAFATREESDLWWLQLLLGLAEVLIGFWAIGYAGRSISLLVVWVGATALARGISSLFMGFALHGAGKELRKRMAGPSATTAGV